MTFVFFLYLAISSLHEELFGNIRGVSYRFPLGKLKHSICVPISSVCDSHLQKNTRKKKTIISLKQFTLKSKRERDGKKIKPEMHPIKRLKHPSTIKSYACTYKRTQNIFNFQIRINFSNISTKHLFWLFSKCEVLR